MDTQETLIEIAHTLRRVEALLDEMVAPSRLYNETQKRIYDTLVEAVGKANSEWSQMPLPPTVITVSTGS